MGGERLDPRAIQIGAIRRGWEIGHARDLADMARSMRRRPRRQGAGGRRVWRRTIFAEWRGHDTAESA
jgi:hypothetical protein